VRLGVALFQRGWSGTEPTAAGELVIARCRRVINELEKADARLPGARRPRGALERHASWHHLQAVAEVVATGSASAAATRLGVRQPAISQALHQLSGRLRMQLFEHRGGGLSPCEPARVLAASWRSILPELADLRASMEKASSGLSGRITVGLLPFSGQDLVMQAFAALTRSHPRLRLAAVPGSYHLLAELLRRREIDLIIGIERTEPLFAQFEQEHLYDEHFHLIARRGHRCHGSAVTIETLAGMQWIVAPHGTPVRTYFEMIFRDLGREPPAQTCEILSFADAEQMIVHSDSVALLSYSRIRIRRLRKQLRRVKFDLPDNRVPITITSLGGYLSNAPLATFVEHLKQVAREAGV
jgi:DNA-binding transcriptional LysR family regulator